MLFRLSALFAALMISACAHDFAYQNTSWGMTQKAAQAARGNEYEHTMINGLKATVSYNYGSRGLDTVTVVFDPIAEAKEKYVEHFRQIKALLVEKYGAPEATAADYVAKADSYRIANATDYEAKSIYRNDFMQVTLTCAGACDGASAMNSITIRYEPPKARTDGL